MADKKLNDIFQPPEDPNFVRFKQLMILCIIILLYIFFCYYE